MCKRRVHVKQSKLSHSLFSNSRGLTLIEIVVVVAIIALMMSLVIGTVGGSARSVAKSEMMRLIATIKYGYNQAAIRQVPFRIAFNLTDKEYWVEEGAESPPEVKEEEADNTDVADDAEENADTSEVSESPAGSTFIPDESRFGLKVKLKEPIKIKDIFLEHQEDVVSDGTVYLYFFPNGMTQYALIHFSDDDEEFDYTVIVNPISGRCTIKPEYLSDDDLKDQ